MGSFFQLTQNPVMFLPQAGAPALLSELLHDHGQIAGRRWPEGGVEVVAPPMQGPGRELRIESSPNGMLELDRRQVGGDFSLEVGEPEPLAGRGRAFDRRSAALATADRPLRFRLR